MAAGSESPSVRGTGETGMTEERFRLYPDDGTNEGGLTRREMVERLLEFVQVLEKCEAVLSQMQDNIKDPEMLQNIIRQGYYGHALMRVRRAMEKLK
jgi:hypothetical protein